MVTIPNFMERNTTIKIRTQSNTESISELLIPLVSASRVLKSSSNPFLALLTTERSLMPGIIGLIIVASLLFSGKKDFFDLICFIDVDLWSQGNAILNHEIIAEFNLLL